jgi:hypothetical protein
MIKKYYPLIAITALVILLLALGVGIGLAEEDDNGLPNDVFLPGVVNRSVLGHGAIAGQVLNQFNFPVAGVNITTDKGVSAVTNSNGVYTLVGLPEGTYTLILIVSTSSTAIDERGCPACCVKRKFHHSGRGSRSHRKWWF